MRDRPPGISIKTKTLILFVGLTLIPLLFITWYLLTSSRTEIRTLINERLMVENRQTADFFNYQVIDKILFDSERLVGLIESLQNSDEATAVRMIEQLLEKSVLMGFAFQDAEKNVLYAANKKQFTGLGEGRMSALMEDLLHQQQPLVNFLLEEDFLYRYEYQIDHIEELDLQVFSAVFPIQLPNGKRAVLLTVTNLSTIRSRLQKLHDSDLVSTLLVDVDFNPLYAYLAPNTESGMREQIMDALKSRMVDARGRLQMDGQSRLLMELPVANEEEYLVSLTQLEDYHLGIISLLPADNAYALLYNFIWKIIGVVIGAQVLIIGVNYIGISRLTRPIKELTSKAALVAKGLFNTRAQVTTRDEVGELATVFNHMVGELDRFHRLNLDKILIEKSKLQHIVSQIGDGILVVEPAGKIIICNRRMKDWFGINGQSVADRSLTDVGELRDFKIVFDQIRQSMENKPIMKNFKLRIRNEIHGRYLQGVGKKVYTQSGKLLALSLVLRDMTSERQMNQMKVDMISFVSHELRSPLTGILGFSEILQSGEHDPGKVTEYAQIINSEGTRLNDFINEFLDLARIESGRMELKREEISVQLLVQKTIEGLQSAAQDRNIRITTDIHSRAETVYGQMSLLRQALANYVSNAIKYSFPASTIQMIVYEEGEFVHFEVIDQGHGISEENRDKVFGKFFRVEDDPNVRAIKGTGLGLSYVKEIVERHQGFVYLESKLQKGSSFGMALPRTPATRDAEGVRDSSVRKI